MAWKIHGFAGEWPSKEEAQAAIDQAKQLSKASFLDEYSRAYYRRMAVTEPHEVKGEA